MKTLFITTSLLLVLATPCLAGPSDGGSNSQEVDGHTVVIEDLSVPSTEVKDLAGYSLFQEKLKLLKKVAPELAAQLEKRLPELDWYLVKGPLDPIAKEKTGLNLPTGQDAFQTDSGEVFLDKDKRATMSEEVAARQLMHEALMSLKADKNSKRVRPVVDSLFDPNPNPLVIQSKLAELQFGPYFSKEQVALQRAQAKQEYLKYIQDVLDVANLRCTSEEDKAKMARHLESPKAEFDLVSSELTDASGSGYDMYGNWTSPFSNLYLQGLNITAGITDKDSFDTLDNHIVTAACQDHKDQFSQAACQDYRDLADKVKANANFPERALRTAAFKSANSNVFHDFWENMADVRTDLAMNPAFTTILAMTASDPLELLDVGRSTDTSKIYASGRDIARAAYAKRKLMNLRDPKTNLKVLCESVASLKATVDQKIAPPASSASPGAQQDGSDGQEGSGDAGSAE